MALMLVGQVGLQIYRLHCFGGSWFQRDFKAVKAAFAIVFYLIKQSIVGHFVDLKSDSLLLCPISRPWANFSSTGSANVCVSSIVGAQSRKSIFMGGAIKASFFSFE
jgi:hypothetical protein